MIDNADNVCYIIIRKGFDEECIFAEPLREVAFGASHRGLNMFVASEPGGRKLFKSQ